MNFRASILLAVVLAACAQDNAPNQTTASRELSVTVGKSVLVDSPQVIERISVANGDLAEAVAITPREILINGKTPGETSLIVWQQGGNRLFFDLTVQRNESRIDDIRREMATEMGSQDVTMSVEGDRSLPGGLVSVYRITNETALWISGSVAAERWTR